MKTKLLYLLTLAGALLLGAAILFAALGGGAVRYHQHLEQPSAASLGVCGACGGKAPLCTHLPLIRIETGGQKIPGRSIHGRDGAFLGYETGDGGASEISVTVETVDQPGVYHHKDDGATCRAQAMFRIRGNSSRAFSKSSYRIKLYENGDPEDGLSLPLLGMDPGSEWALHGPFLDKTLIRNYMWMNLSAEVMGDAPDVRFCEVLLDGAYQGLYLLMETVSEGPGRVDLTDYSPGGPLTGYILRIGGRLNPAKTLDTFSCYTGRLEAGKQVELLYPVTAMQTARVQEAAAADFNRIEKLLYSEQMARGAGQYRREIDVDSFVDYYLLQEFLAINDAFSESTYFYRDMRGKLHIGPVWDYNNALDNFLLPLPAEGFLLDQRGWFGRLMMDDFFVEKVIGRWKSLRRGVLQEDRLNRYIDETAAWLGSAVDRNFAVWGYSFDAAKLSSLERRRPDARAGGAESGQTVSSLNPASFVAALEQMRTYMNVRGRWMDRNIETLRRYCRESKNAAQIFD